MKRIIKTLILATFTAMLSPLTFAQTIDQNAPANTGNMANFDQGLLAQSFKQAASNIVGAGILLHNAGHQTTDTVTISLYDKLPINGGSMLASASTTGYAPNWADVFWPSVSITPETTYYLVISGNNTLSIAGDEFDGYTRGNLFLNNSAYPSYDFTFRTYAGTVAAVPEPETYAMMLAGLGLLGVTARRSKKKQTA